MKKFIILTILLGSLSLPSQAETIKLDPLASPYLKEANYIEYFCNKKLGQSEVSVSGGRADCVNDRYAWEVEYANKWKEGVTQASWYAQQLNKVPALLIILRKPSDKKYLYYIEDFLVHYGIFIHIDTIEIY